MSKLVNPANNDSDGNGTPDGLEDSDGDGISNSRELELGTKLDVDDTDEDGINDGDEINIYFTDPLKEDTDGDDVIDGLEVATGSDPRDPDSVNIAPYVTNLRLTPANPELQFADDIPPLQLTVNATLKVNGTEYDLNITEERFGTIYGSTDTAVVLHTADGAFTILQDGTATLSVQINGLTAETELMVHPSTENSMSVRLLPTDKPQVLYAGSGFAMLTFEIRSKNPVSWDDIALDGEWLDYYRARNPDGSIDGNPNAPYILYDPTLYDLYDVDAAFSVVWPNGVPADIEGLLEVDVYNAVDDSYETLEFQIPVQPDPQADVQLKAGQPTTLNLKVGQALEVPLQVTDPGMNPLKVEYLLNGVPLENRYSPYPEIQIGQSIEGTFSTSTDGYGNIQAPVQLYRLTVSEDKTIGANSALHVDYDGYPPGYIYLFRDDGNPDETDYIGRLDWGSMPVMRGRYIIAVAFDSMNSATSTVYDCYYCSYGSSPYTYSIEIYEDEYGGYGGYGGETAAQSSYPTEMAVYEPILQLDGSIEYEEASNAYILTEDDIGAGQELVVRVTEQNYFGEDDEYGGSIGGIADTIHEIQMTLNVEAADPSCSVPEASVVYPQNGEIFYDLYDAYEEPVSYGGYGGEMPMPHMSVVINDNDSYSGRSGNFKPITIRSSAEGSAVSVEWTNAPSNLVPGIDYRLVSTDGVYYELKGNSAYEAIFDGMTEVEFGITTACGQSAELTVPITVTPDPGPEVNFAPQLPGAMTINKGEIGTLPFIYSDAGKNLQKAAAYLFVPGESDPANAVPLAEFSWEMALNPITDTCGEGCYAFGYEGIVPDYGLGLAMQSNTARVNLPYAAMDLSIPNGVYDLRMQVVDSKGNSTLSEPITVTIAPPLFPPSLYVTVPDYSVPAGAYFDVYIESEYIDELEDAIINISGPVVGDGTRFMRSDGREIEGSQSFQVDESANVGDIITLTVQVTSVGGKTVTIEKTVTVGEWGAQTVEVTGTKNIDGSMRYANVVLKSGALLRYTTEQYPVNSIHLENGAAMEVSSGVDLVVNDQLQIDAGATLKVNGVSSDKHNGKANYGGYHGGYSYSGGNAYDDFRNPTYPGASAGARYRYRYSSSPRIGASGGGILDIQVDKLIVNGQITAIGSQPTQDNYCSTYQYCYYGAGAGGSIRINAKNVSGNGAIRANGGNAPYSSQGAGAGGHIAVYYDQYEDGSVDINNILTIEALSGTAAGGTTYVAAPGTVFTKRTDQLFGELHVLAKDRSTSRNGVYTEMRSLGRRYIESIELVPGTIDHYRVTFEGDAAYVPQDYWWEKGLVDTYISLDADDKDALLYRVIDNTASTITIISSSDPSSNIGNQLIDVIRLDKLVIDANAILASNGRIDVNTAQADNVESVEKIAEIVSRQSFTEGVLQLQQQNRLYIGDLTADEITLNQALLAVYGDLVVNGDATLTGNDTALNVSGTVQVGGALALTDSTAMLRTNNLAVNGAVNLSNSTLELATNAVVDLGATLDIVSNSILTVPDPGSMAGYYQLQLNVAGAVNLEAGSAIQLTGKSGYYNGPLAGMASGAYGGDTSHPAYGDYAAPTLPGSYNSSNGGGYLYLATPYLSLNGSIEANGEGASTYTGSGGGIYLDIAGDLSGTGTISANGGASTYSSTYYSDRVTGAGGRISVVYETKDQFSGTIEAKSGERIDQQARGGAGTIYLKPHAVEYGELIVDNEIGGQSYLTPRPAVLRSIGRHQISSSVQVAPGRWSIEVAGHPWVAPENSLGKLGLIGLSVDLDAATETGLLYQVVDNSENTLIIETADNLSNIVGQTLIGEITLQRLSVINGGYLHTDDRVIVLDPSGLQFDANSYVSVGEFTESTTEYVLNNINGATVELGAGLNRQDFVIQNGYLILNGSLQVAGALSIGPDGKLSAHDVHANSLLIDSGELETIALDVNTDVQLINGGIITIPDLSGEASTSTRHLDIFSGGEVSIDSNSSIDVSGKGSLPYDKIFSFDSGGRWDRRCFAGAYHSNYDGYGCNYGDYRKAEFQGHQGGGALQLRADRLFLDGKISANGEVPYDSDINGTGGSVNIEVEQFSGNGVGGGITANASYGTSVSGGRVRITADTIYTYNGVISAAGGGSGASGTVFIRKPGQQNGELILDNRHVAKNASTGLTTIRDIGKHTITAVESLGNEKWKISIGEDHGVHQEFSGELTQSGVGSVGYHRFTLDQPRSVMIMHYGADYPNDIILFKDDGNLDYDDWITVGGFNSGSNDYVNTLKVNLEQGDYVVAITPPDEAIGEAIQGYRTNPTGFAGPYQLSVHTRSSSAGEIGGTWNPVYGLDLSGYQVSLNADDPAQPIYEVIENGEEYLIVRTADNLSGQDLIGKEMVGVHRLDGLTISGGARVDFGDDRVDIASSGSAALDSLSELSMGNINQDIAADLIANLGVYSVLEIREPVTMAEHYQTQGTLRLNSLQTTAGPVALSATANLEIINDLSSMLSITQTGNSNLTVGGVLKANDQLAVASTGQLKTAEITAESFTVTDGAITTESIRVDGNVTLMDGVLTSPMATTHDQVNLLEIDAGGTITVDSNGVIDLDGKGYLYGDGGPDPIYITSFGCHGGTGSTTTDDCAYGKLDDPKFAGSGGSYHYTGIFSHGGGVLIARASEFINNGVITANGEYGANGSAGGSINIEANSISGSSSGAFRVNGGASQNSSSSYYRGGGGRLALKAGGNINFVGELSAKGGVTGSYAGIGGAGTIYLKSPDFPNGHLVVQGVVNGSETAASGSTPIRSVGRHTIQNAVDQNDGTWLVSIGPSRQVHNAVSGNITSSGADSLVTNSFTLVEEATVHISAVTDFSSMMEMYLLRDNVRVMQEFVEGNSKQWVVSLTPGNYKCVIGNDSYSLSEAISGARYDNNPGEEAEYNLTIDSFNGTWRPTNVEAGTDISGNQVDLDADSAGNAIYTIQSNMEESIVIATDDDLSGYIGKDLIGVHQFSRITATDGAKVTFGEDRVIIDDVGQSEISNQSEVIAAPDSILPDPEP